MWIHIQSNKKYVGSALNLSERMYKCFSPLFLKRTDNYIFRVLIHYGYSVFSLSIIKFIDITNLSKKEARKLILEHEQFYLDLIFSQDEPNTYNMLQVAGSRLGASHSEKTKAILCEANKGKNNPMYGRTGDDHPRGMLGKIHSAETLVKMSEALSGQNHPMFGKIHSEESKALISKTKSNTIFVYNSQGLLANSFNSTRKAAEFYGCSHVSIFNFLNNLPLFKKQWILSTSLINNSKAYNILLYSLFV